jgi:CII-binding regulator of phage lambda lysogenization HflD
MVAAARGRSHLTQQQQQGQQAVLHQQQQQRRRGTLMAALRQTMPWQQLSNSSKHSSKC